MKSQQSRRDQEMNPTTEEMAVSTETPTWQELRACPRYTTDHESIRVRIKSNGSTPVVAVLVDESSDGIVVRMPGFKSVVSENV